MGENCSSRCTPSGVKASFDVSTTKIGPYLLVVRGTEEKKVRNPKVYISPHRPDDPFGPIVTNFGKVGGMDDVSSRAKFGVDRSRDVGCAGREK